MVDWKQLPKIDAHVHLLPDDVIRANQGCGDVFVEYGSAVDYLSLMEEYCIERAIVMPFNDPYMLSMDFTVETVHANLRRSAEASQGKLLCFADVDIRRSGEDTLAELECVLSHQAFVGIKLHPSNAGYPIDGAYYDRIFRYACERSILVEIHSYPRTHLVDDVCSPSRIRCVLERYPRLRVSIAHLGGLQYEALTDLPAYVNLSAVLPELVKHLGIAETNCVLRRIGVDKLVFATDYPDSRSLKPGEIYDTYCDILGQMDFTLDEAKRICRENALNMLSRR